MPFVSAKAPPVLLLASTREPQCNATDGLSWHLGSNNRFCSPFASLSSSSAVHAALGGPQKPPTLASPSQVQLPFGVKKGATTLRYVWDSNGGMQALDEETLRNGKDDGGSYFRRLILSLQDQLYKAFIPNKEDVTDDYWEWLRWRLTQRLFSSTLQNLSTQSMLIALGLGAKRTIAASAAINWLLKDGVGRIARMTVATSFCQSFDSDLKRIRYVTSLIFDTTIACEFLTPFFPQHFLALASLANVGKAIALAAFVAVQPAFQRAMCSGGNLADITAKNQAQHMVVDMVALGISAVAMYTVRNSERGRILVPLLAYPLLAGLDLWAIYNELKAVELRVCNKERAEMVAAKWLQSGKMPSASEVSQEERLLFPADVSGGLLPLHITSINRVVSSLQEAQALSRQYKDEQYMMALHNPEPRSASVPEVVQRRGDRGLMGQLQKLVGRQPPQPELRVTLSDKAASTDIFKAVLHAAYLRQMLKTKLQDKLAHYQACTQDGQGARPVAAAQSGHEDSMRGDELWTMAGALIPPSELEGCMAQAKVKAQKGLERFLQELQAHGWRTRTVLLSTTEKFRYIKLAAEKQ